MSLYERLGASVGIIILLTILLKIILPIQLSHLDLII